MGEVLRWVPTLAGCTNTLWSFASPSGRTVEPDPPPPLLGAVNDPVSVSSPARPPSPSVSSALLSSDASRDREESLAVCATVSAFLSAPQAASLTGEMATRIVTHAGRLQHSCVCA